MCAHTYSLSQILTAQSTPKYTTCITDGASLQGKNNMSCAGKGVSLPVPSWKDLTAHIDDIATAVSNGDTEYVCKLSKTKQATVKMFKGKTQVRHAAYWSTAICYRQLSRLTQNQFLFNMVILHDSHATHSCQGLNLLLADRRGSVQGCMGPTGAQECFA